MARPFTAPDPKDRSVNEPSQVVSANQVLGYYNQHQDKGGKKERVVESVREWYESQMRASGWAEAIFHGNQCVLTAKVKLENEDHGA